jgi:hypothetical protein
MPLPSAIRTIRRTSKFLLVLATSFLVLTSGVNAADLIFDLHEAHCSHHDADTSAGDEGQSHSCAQYGCECGAQYVAGESVIAVTESRYNGACNFVIGNDYAPDAPVFEIDHPPQLRA